MRKPVFIILIISFTLGCSSKKMTSIPEKYSGNDVKKSYLADGVIIGRQSYSYLIHDQPIKFKIVAYQPVSKFVNGNVLGFPTAVIIGKTNVEYLPDTLTILAVGERRNFKLNQTLLAIPNKQIDTSKLQLNSEIDENKPLKREYLLGSKFKAIIATIEDVK